MVASTVEKVEQRSITIPATFTNGTVTATPTSAASGTDVTLTVTPDSGYKTESVTVETASGTSIDVTDNGDGTYTFTMPDEEVIVSVVFEEEVQERNKDGIEDELEGDRLSDEPLGRIGIALSEFD